MPDENKSRIQLLKVLEILKKYSDCDHNINASQIEERLNEMGIQAGRRSIYKDISALIECGYDINKAQSSKNGFYYDCREFELPEIRLLIDAVEGAPFITRKKTNELTERLLSMLSVYQGNLITGSVYGGERHKFKNEEIYYNIDRINDAINRNKKISFMYYHKAVKNGQLTNNDGRKFILSPYGLFWAADRYYLAANYEKYNDISNFRIDRMKKVHIIEEDRRDVSEVSEYEIFDIADYVKKSILAFSGSGERLKLEFPTELLDIITDKFGEDIELIRKGDDMLTVSLTLNISEGLINWLIPYADKINVLKPEHLHSAVKERINSIYNTINK